MGCCVVGDSLVGREGCLGKLISILFYNFFCWQIFIVPFIGFGGGSENWLWELGAVVQTVGKIDAADAVIFLVRLPAGTG